MTKSRLVLLDERNEKVLSRTVTTEDYAQLSVILHNGFCYVYSCVASTVNTLRFLRQKHTEIK